MKLFPFFLTIQGLTLRGKDREAAKIIYEHPPSPDRDVKVAEVLHGIDSDEVKYAMIESKIASGTSLDFEELVFLTENDEEISDFERENQLDKLRLEWGVITEAEYDYRITDRSPTATELEKTLAKLERDYAAGDMTDNDFHKEVATAKGEAWIGIVDHGFEPEKGINGVFFQFDWNDLWIEELKAAGYMGHSPEQIVEQWFSHLCMTQGSEFEGTGSDPMPFNSGRTFDRNGQAYVR